MAGARRPRPGRRAAAEDLAALVARMAALQRLFYADGRYALLLVL